MWQVCIPDVSSDKCTGSLGNSGQGRIVLRNIYQKAPLQYCRAVLLSTTSERRCLWRDCSLPSPYFPCLVQLIWKDTCLTHTVLIPPWPHFSPVWCGPSDAVGDGFCCSATVLSSHGPYWEFPDLLVIFQSVFFLIKWWSWWVKYYPGQVLVLEILTFSVHRERSYSPSLFWDAESCQIMDR